MKYIYILILYIFLIQNLLSANENIENSCKNFVVSPQKEIIDSELNEDILFKTGVLWKITTPKKEINYIYGTIHSQDYLVSKFPYEVESALIKSNKLILEIIPDIKASTIYKKHIYFNNGIQLDDLLGEYFFKKLEKQIKYYDLENIELNNLKYMKPWAAFNIIGRPKTIRAPSLESNLLKFAKKMMIEIDSLETMNDITSALDQLSINDQLNILKDTICNHNNIANEIKILINLYLNRDNIGIIKLSNNKNSKDETYLRYLEKMLYDRNKEMLKKITEEFNEGGAFVAVGILHLIVKNGLLKNLQDLDYTIEVIY